MNYSDSNLTSTSKGTNNLNIQSNITNTINDSDIEWIPHDYQDKTIDHVIENELSGVFLDPGLGKTSITLHCINYLIDRFEIKSALIIAPLEVILNTWPYEIQKWSNFKNLTYTVLHKKGKNDLWGDRKDIYLINPNGLKWLVKELETGIKANKVPPFNALWVDESTDFKNHKGGRFALLSALSFLFKRRHIMTGTPASKTYIDLWSQLFICDHGNALGKNFYGYRRKHFISTDYMQYNWQVTKEGKTAIKQALAKVVIDIGAKGNIKLPDIIFNKIDVVLSKRDMKIYKSMENKYFIKMDELEGIDNKSNKNKNSISFNDYIDKFYDDEDSASNTNEYGNSEVTAQAAAQASMKCHQIAQGAVYEDVPEELQTKKEISEFKKRRKVIVIHDGKLLALKNLISGLNGKPILIAYHFNHDLERIRKFIGKDTPYIGSGVKPKEVKRIIGLWNKGEIPVLLGNPVKMSRGLNLQGGGNDICWFSLTWNLEHYIQFNARLWRQGVKGTVRIHQLVCSNTTDEIMMARLSNRDNDQKDLRSSIRDYRNSSK